MVVVGLNVSNVAKLVAPETEPTSITYDEGATPVGAVHVSVTSEPETVNPKPVGALGSGHPLPTVATTSFDGTLRPARLRARTRTKYVPGGADAVTAGVRPSGNVPMSVAPAVVPASSTYEEGAPPSIGGC